MTAEASVPEPGLRVDDPVDVRAAVVTEPDTDLAEPDTDVAEPDTDVTETDVDALAPVVDWSRTGRRLGSILAVLGVVVVATWLVTGFAGDGPTLRALAELVGLGVLAAIAVEVVVVGGAAVRGLLRAGERGDRLASDDVSLLPPQLLRRRR